jgi:CRISPR-associated endonuclease/helicase Cas3
MAELLAKPDTDLLTHLVEVTRLGQRIADRLSLPEPLRTKALLACALHDIGKATIDFQEYIRGLRKRAYPHALASLPLALLCERLLNQNLKLLPTHYEATVAVLTHHSPLSTHLYQGYEAPAYAPELQKALGDVWNFLAELGAKGLPPLETFWQNVQPLLQNSPAALLDASQQIGNENKTLRGILQDLSVADFACVKAILHLADWLASARQSEPQVLFLRDGLSAVRQHMQSLNAPMRKFQEKARQSEDTEVLWLRAPTGTGKTEALLLWAGETERLIYLLPTQATTNAMWRRLCKIYGADAVGLAHGHAAYVLRRESDEDPLDLRLFGSVFAKPVTVATLDQYLLAHLNGRHWEERRSLARKATVIIDEIHAYEPYTLGLLLEALEREKPARLALASATLPRALLRLFPAGREVEAEDSLWARKRYRLELRKGFLQDGLEEAVNLARQNKKVLIVANTVPDAQGLYRRLRDEFRWERRHVLHARFTLRDRQQREDQVEKPEPGTIFIATQVVEVSLDISYDVLFTEIAPLDALVQRMGRVNRMGQGPSASVHRLLRDIPGRSAHLWHRDSGKERRSLEKSWGDADRPRAC